MLQPCYNHVTSVLQPRYNRVTSVLQLCYNHVTTMLLLCYNHVTSKCSNANDTFHLYVSHHNRHTISGKEYSAKVMFQVLIEPGTFQISAQTVDPKNANIDEHFDNSELEWSTKSHVSIILHHMYVKLERQATQ